MKLQPYLSSGPKIKINKWQQQEFIKLLQDQDMDDLVKLGLKKALISIGYEVLNEDTKDGMYYVEFKTN